MKSIFRIIRDNAKSVYFDENGVCFDTPNSVGYNPVSFTEVAGYKPPRLQVLDFLIAGERLVASQKQKYYQSDFEEVFDDNGNIVMPKIARSYDALEAKQVLDEFNIKFKEYKELSDKRLIDEYNSRLAELKSYQDSIKNQKENTAE